MAMQVVRISPNEYKEIVQDRRVFFNEPDFCELNRHKVDDVHYLIIKKGESARFGIILGCTAAVAKCPFSAPYSYPVSIRADEKMASFDDALAALEEYCALQGIAEIRFVFPPLFYDEHLLSGWISVLLRNNYKLSYADVNYLIDLKRMQNMGKGYLNKSARSHLCKAIRSGMTVCECKQDEDIAEAYDIVRRNHDAKKRPTHLSLAELKRTMELVDHWVFIAKADGVGIGTQIFYQTSKKIVQCIYSGFLLEHTNAGSMNYITDHSIRYFGELSFDYIDRATASVSGIPNYGLCDFKESVGCRRSLKYSFEKRLA